MFTGIWLKLGAALAAVLAIVGVLWRAFALGKQSARGEQAQKNEETRDAMDKARADAPRDADGVVDRLRRGGF